MNDFASEPSEGATSSLLAQKSQIERVSTNYLFGGNYHKKVYTICKNISVFNKFWTKLHLSHHIDGLQPLCF